MAGHEKRRSVLAVLFLTLLLDMIGIGMLIPIIPSLFTDPNSPSFLLQGYHETSMYVIAGLVTALFGFMQFLAAPILGELSDLYGRKRLLAIGVGVLAIANLVFATGIAIGSLLVLLASRMIAGIAGANFSIAQAVVADVTPPEDRAKNFGIIGAAFGIGFILGPLLGGVLAGWSGDPAVPFIFAGVLGIINVLMLMFLLPETHAPREYRARPTVLRAFHNITAAWEDRDIRPLYAASFLWGLGFTFFTAFIPVYLVEYFDFTESSTGLYFAIVGGWIIFTQAVVVRFVCSRYSEQKILLWSLPVIAATIAVHPFIYDYAILYTVMPFMAVAVGLASTTTPALVSQGVGADKQGAALGINGSLQALTQGLAPLVAGVSSSILGLNATFITGAVIVLIATELVRRTRQKST